MLDEARDRSVAFAEATTARSPKSMRPALAAAMRELEEIFDMIGRAGSYASLWFTVDTTDPERGALLQQVRERGAEIETSLLFFELEWNEVAGRAGRGATGRRRHRVLPPSPAHVAPLPPAPADGARGACAHRGRCHRPLGLPPPLHRADLLRSSVDLPDADEPVPLMEALSRLQDPDRERRARGRGSRDRVASARPPNPRVHLQHAPSGQVDEATACARTTIGSRPATSRTRPRTNRSRR